MRTWCVEIQERFHSRSFSPAWTDPPCITVKLVFVSNLFWAIKMGTAESRNGPTKKVKNNWIGRNYVWPKWDEHLIELVIWPTTKTSVFRFLWLHCDHQSDIVSAIDGISGNIIGRITSPAVVHNSSVEIIGNEANLGQDWDSLSFSRIFLTQFKLRRQVGKAQKGSRLNAKNLAGSTSVKESSVDE